MSRDLAGGLPDFVVFSNGTKEETVAFKEEMRAWLARALHLTLSDEKTAITHYRDGFDFLGFTFKKTEARSGGREVVVHYPSTASVQRAVRRVAEITDRSQIRKSREDVILALNTFLRGWGDYFRHSSAKRALAYIGSRAFMRMWAWLVNKDYGNTRRGWRATKAKYHHENTWRVGKHQLMVLATMPVEYPRHRIVPHPYLLGRAVVEPWHRDPFRTRWDGWREYGDDWRPAMEAAAERAGNACVTCGATDDVEFHHIKARRRGGGNTPRQPRAALRTVPPCRRTPQQRGQSPTAPDSHLTLESCVTRKCHAQFGERGCEDRPGASPARRPAPTP
jgi:RNA-directed DNA polymerase